MGNPTRESVAADPSRRSGHDHLGDAGFGWREQRELCMWLGLIPVADRVEVVGAVVGVAVFDCDLDGFFEGDESFSVPSVKTVTASGPLGINDVGSALTHVGKGI